MKKIYITLTLILLSNLYFSQTYTLNSASTGTTVSTCSGTFVDDGGSGGNYSNNQNTVITFCPATPGDIIKVTFTSLALRSAGGGGCQDILDVYQGDAAYAGPLITAGTPDDRLCGTYTGTNLPVFYSTSATGCITFNFISDGSAVLAGWTATISCVTPCKNPTAALSNSSILNICGPGSNSPGSLSVNFDASTSSLGAYGPGGSTVTITNYNWNFGDGTSATTSSATTSHTYPNAPGVYVMKISVSDNNTDVSPSGCSSTNSVTKIIRVLPSPTFTASTNSPQNIGCGSNATLTGVAKSQTETQSIPAVSGVTVALPDGSGSSFVSNADFSGLFPSGSTIASGCYPTLYFNLEHSFSPDLTIDLIAPSGQTVRVFNRHGLGGMFGPLYMFGACVDGADDGVPGCGATYSVANSGGQSWTNYSAAAITNTVSTPCAGWAGPCQGGTAANPYYKPTLYNSTNSFAALNGATMNGTWQLKITDNQALDDGFLFSWGLVFPASCYSPLESITPSLTNVVWTNGGSGPAVPGSQTTTSITVTDPGPDACPTAGTCTGNQLTNTITFGPFNTPGTYPYLFTATDQFGCTYTKTVNVAVSCVCPSLTAVAYGGPFCKSLTSSVTPTVTGTGGISSGSYSSTPAGLSINAATGVITPSLSTASTYTVTYSVAASGTCVAVSINTVIVINATPTIAVNSPTICSGTSTVLTASGGTTYSWTPATNLSSTSGATVSANPGTSIQYTVTGTTSGCSGSAVSNVSVNPTPTIGVNSEIICSGTSTVLTVNSGLPGTTYTWSPGTNLSATSGSVVTANPTTTTQYTVTATLNGCSGSAVSIVSVNPTPSITVNNPTICSGTSTLLTVNGGLAGTSYTWSPGTNLSATTGSAVTSSPTTTTQYTIIATLNGCSGSVVSTVSVNPTPTITVNSPVICSGTSTLLTANGGAPGTTYSWSPGTNLSATTGSAVTSSATTTTQYTVTATLNGCSGSAISTVSVNATPTVAVTNTTICNGNSVILTASGATTYSWSTGALTSTISVSPTSLTVYTVTGTTNGCTNTKTVSVTVTANPTVAVTNTTICNGSSVTLTASGATTYSWSTGALTPTISVSPTSLTVYTVTGTTSGCTNTQTVSVTVTANPTVAVANATICAGTSTVITATGASTYSWSTGAATSTISVSTAGVYTVTGTTNGCTNTKTVSLTVSPTPTTIANVTGTITCSTPSVTLSSSVSGLSYTWTAPSGGIVSSPNSQSTSASASQGIYTLNVQSAAGCTFVTTASVTQNTTAPTGVSAGSNQTLGCGSATVVTLTGSAATPTNATAGWAGPSVSGSTTSFVTSANGAGIYTLTATNPANGCMATSTVQVMPNAGAPTLTINPVTNTITCTNTMVTVGITSTVSPVSYAWSGPGILTGNGTGTITVNQGGTYNFTLTNTTNSCTASGNTVVVQSTTTPTTTASTTGVLTCSTTTVTLNSTLSGMNYTWTAPAGGSVSTASTQATIASGAPGTYTLMVLNPANGCTFTTTTSVSQNTTVPVTAAASNGTLTCVTSTVALTSTLTGMNYTWTAPSGGSVSTSSTQATVASGAPGDYTLTVVDPNNGCTYTTSANVPQDITIPTGVSAGSNQTLTCPSNSVTLTGSVSTPANPTINWAGPNVCGTSTVLVTSACMAGDYTLTVTDPGNGCSTSSIVTVAPNAGTPTVSISASTLTLDCISSSQSVTVTSAPTSDVTYSWSPAPSSLSASGDVATFNTPNTYTCTVTNTLSNCFTTVQVAVSQSASLPVTMASSNGTLTCVTSTVALTSTLTGMNYTWTAPAGGSVSTSSTQATIASGAPGNYTLAVLDPSNGCTFTTTANVPQDITAPTGVSAGSNQTLACGASSSVTLTGSVATPTNAMVDWGTGVCGTQTTVVTEACAAGIYTLTATDPANGCMATSTVQVFANAEAPSATITPSALTIDCINTTQSATVTSTPSTDVVYNWIGNTPASASADSSMATFNAQGTYICVVTNTLSGCTTTVQVIVTSNTTPPSVSISPTQTLTCVSPTAVISLTTTGTTFNWSGTSPIVSGQGTSAITVNSGGDYTATITAANGCTATASAHIDVDQTPPTVSISAPSNSVITCQNTSFNLLASVTPTNATYTYTWSPSNNGGTSEPVSGQGSYNVVVTNTLTGCTATASPIAITSNTTPPTVSVSDATIACGANSTPIGGPAITTATNVNYNWSTSGPGIITGGSSSTPTVNATGAYVVTVTDIDNDCTNTGTVNVSQTNVSAAFTANPMSGTAPLDVNFSNQSTGANSYSWNFGDATSASNTSTATNPSHTYDMIGMYTVTLTAMNGTCTAFATLTIEVLENSSVIIPNVFTPNGDRSNDLFKITSTGLEELNCDIFNRWGSKLHTINTVYGSWDGGSAPDGTYFFILTAKGYDGKEYKQQGFISLFR